MSIRNGDYVLATKWSDGSPNDQWCVGFYAGFINGRHMVVDGDGVHFRVGGFRRCERISRDRGEFILNDSSRVGSFGWSLWKWKRTKIGVFE